MNGKSEKSLLLHSLPSQERPSLFGVD